jgi:transcriptional regulator with XRE-family HTH domain
LNLNHDPDFPEWLFAWRQRMGLTQKQAAEALCVPKKSISNWEQGVRTCNHPFTLRALAAYIEKSRAGKSKAPASL